MKVFVGGSRRISRLNDDVRCRLDNIIDKSIDILVGDANGADRSVQKYCLGREYSHVTVFCSGGSCRNNLGGWNVRHVEVSHQSRSRSFYTAKDLEMARAADYGFMLWDGESTGTLKNVLELLALGKVVLVYFFPEKNFYKIKTYDNLTALLDKCNPDALEDFEQKLDLARRLMDHQVPKQQLMHLPDLDSSESGLDSVHEEVSYPS